MTDQFRRYAFFFALAACLLTGVLLLDSGDIPPGISRGGEAALPEDEALSDGSERIPDRENPIALNLDSPAETEVCGERGNFETNLSSRPFIPSRSISMAIADSFTQDATRRRSTRPIGNSRRTADTDMVAVVGGIAARGDYKTAAAIIAASVEGRALAESTGMDDALLRDSIAQGLARYLSRPPARNIDAESRRLMEDTRVRSLMDSMGMREGDMKAVVEEFLRLRVTQGDIRSTPSEPTIKPRSYEPVSPEPRAY